MIPQLLKLKILEAIPKLRFESPSKCKARAGDHLYRLPGRREDHGSLPEGLRFKGFGGLGNKGLGVLGLRV